MKFDWTYDEVVLATELVADNQFRGLRAHQPPVVHLSELLRRAPLHPLEGRSARFRSPSSVQRKTFDIATRHDDYQGRQTKGGQFEDRVLREFIHEPERMRMLAEAIRAAIAEGDVASIPEEVDLDEMWAAEGRLLVAKHMRRERNAQLREAKIRQVKSEGDTVSCWVCGFDYLARYGELGRDYIEVHHILPLHASGPTRTRLQDLVLLCSNCHRMIHRSRPWLTPRQLQSALCPTTSSPTETHRLSVPGEGRLGTDARSVGPRHFRW